MNACMHGCMDAWMHGCMDAWIHGCMDAWMDACMYVCMYVSNRIHIIWILYHRYLIGTEYLFNYIYIISGTLSTKIGI